MQNKRKGLLDTQTSILAISLHGVNPKSSPSNQVKIGPARTNHQKKGGSLEANNGGRRSDIE